MSARRAIGTAAAAAMAAMALRALDRAEEARALLAPAAREVSAAAHDPDLEPVQQAWSMPNDGGAGNAP